MRVVALSAAILPAFASWVGCSISEGILGRMGGGAGGNDSSTSSAADAGFTDGSPPLPDSGALACEARLRFTITSQGDAPAHEACTTTLAQTTFLNALCTCHDATFGDGLQTHGFDSRVGPYRSGQPDDSGAAVGINRSYGMPIGYSNIGGSFSVAGTGPTRLAGQLEVRGDFRARGDVIIAVASGTHVARDAWLEGALTSLGSLQIDGTLHHQGQVTALVQTVTNSVQEAVTIPAPCPCSLQDLLGVDALVGQAMASNDDATIGIDASTLGRLGGSTALTLPCGRFYVDAVAGPGNLTLDVTGPAALFVGGSVNVGGSFTVRLAAGAEFDLFIRRDLMIGGKAVFGQTDRPYATRIYVGGSHDIVLGPEFVGNLYAPLATVWMTAPTNVWGSVFADSLSSPSSATFYYDRAVVSRTVTCPAPVPEAGCEPCGFCAGGAACINGTCAPCRTDSDCCSQSVCTEGACSPLVNVR